MSGALPSGQAVAADAAEPEVSALRASIPSAGECRNCGGEGWVCENHRDRPWEGMSARDDACPCGAGAPCGVCNLRLAAAAYSEPWRDLALRAIDSVESAVRETNWGQPTFGPDADDELRAEYNAILAQAMSASGQDPQGLEAKPASAVPKGCAQ